MTTGLLDLGVTSNSKSSLFDKAAGHTPSTFASHHYRPVKRLISLTEKKSLKSTLISDSASSTRALVMGLSPEIDEIMAIGFPSYMVYVVDNDPTIQEKLSRPLYSHIPKYFGDVSEAIRVAQGTFSYAHLDYMCMFKPDASKSIEMLVPKLHLVSRMRFSFDTSNRGRAGKEGRYSKYLKYCEGIYDSLARTDIRLLDPEFRARVLRHSTEPVFCAFLKVLKESIKIQARITPNPTVINYRDTTRMQTGWIGLTKLRFTPPDLLVDLKQILSAFDNPTPAPVV